ncbi:MAG: phenylalanine--tRNA ligase subunit beta, partial [Actinomycetota bacterium]|nr:phenylalanine--tRNA ligase subunit beta [Actinomycetota bacterium]
EAAEADFFAIKGVLEHVLATLRIAATFAPADGVWPFLHPGRSAAVTIGGARAGFVGEVHPAVSGAWDLPHAAAIFAVDLGTVLGAAPDVTTYADLTSFPALRLDLAVVLDEAVPAARVLEVVRGAGGNRLADASVFDVYAGDQLAPGNRSLALHLEFRASDATLTDADVAPARDKIVRTLAAELGGELRG